MSPSKDETLKQHTMKLSVLTPEMTMINFTNNPTIEQVLSFIYKSWKKHTESESFQDWADWLNESGNFESTFSAFDALDNLVSEYRLLVNKVDIGAEKLSQLISNKYNVK